MRIQSDVKLDFEDVLLVPQRSSLSTRAEVILEREYRFPHSKREWTGIGVISANMDAVGTFAMAKELAKHNMLTALHKHYPEDELVNFFHENPELQNNVFYTVGSSEEDWKKLIRVRMELFKRGGPWTLDEFPKFLNIDVANGYTETFVDSVKKYRKEYPDTVIMAGTVVTANMTEELILSGADIARIGIGGGSCCITRLVAGVGVPQLSAVDECSFAAHGNPRGHVCSDGGCAYPGDVVKAFAVGADFVMLGGMFSGTDECSGDWVEKNGEKYLKFYGMSSKDAQLKYNGGLASHRASEGKTVYVKYKGPASDVVQEILGGLRSACTYVGANRLKDLPKCAKFIKVNRTHNKTFGE